MHALIHARCHRTNTPLLVRSKIRLDDGTGVRGDTGPEVGTLLSDTVTLISTMPGH